MVYIWLFLIGLLALAFIGLVVAVVGVLLGALLGGVTGGLRGWWQSPDGSRELGVYRGLTCGGCLGALFGLVVAVVLLAWAWHHYLA